MGPDGNWQKQRQFATRFVIPLTASFHWICQMPSFHILPRDTIVYSELLANMCWLNVKIVLQFCAILAFSLGRRADSFLDAPWFVDRLTECIFVNLINQYFLHIYRIHSAYTHFLCSLLRPGIANHLSISYPSSIIQLKQFLSIIDSCWNREIHICMFGKLTKWLLNCLYFLWYVLLK